MRLQSAVQAWFNVHELQEQRPKPNSDHHSDDQPSSFFFLQTACRAGARARFSTSATAVTFALSTCGE